METTSDTETEKEAGKSKIPSLRTLKLDTADYIKEKKVSLVDIVSQEAKSRRLVAEEENGRVSFQKIILIISLIVLIVGAGLATFLFFKNKKESSQISLIKPIIYADSQKEVVLSDNNNQKFLTDIKDILKEQIKIGDIIYIPLFKQTNETKQILTSQEFLEVAGIKPPADLTDSLDSQFMLAKYSLNKEWPILIFKIDSYDYAFSGMIKWEETMASDLQDFFSLANVNTAGVFEDKAIQNRDIRVLKEKDGQTIMIYSFINRDYLVIMQNEEPLKEVFKRFTSLY